jgi:hypothetical protein
LPGIKRMTLRVFTVLAGASVGGAETFFVSLTVALKAAGPEVRSVLKANRDRETALAFRHQAALLRRSRARQLAVIVARCEGVAQLCDPERVEGLFAADGANSHKHLATACWQLLFYALWHCIHVEGPDSHGDVMAVLESR